MWKPEADEIVSPSDAGARFAEPVMNPKKGVTLEHPTGDHRRITTLEHDAPGAIELAPRAAKSLSPAVSPAHRVGSVERRESDPAVMLGFVALVVACWLVAAMFAVGLWLVT
jgi:hypothetical protein